MVFFPSFAYADEVYEHWQASGALRSLSNRKHVFREPRSAMEVELVLRQVTGSDIPRHKSLLTDHEGMSPNGLSEMPRKPRPGTITQQPLWCMPLSCERLDIVLLRDIELLWRLLAAMSCMDALRPCMR